MLGLILSGCIVASKVKDYLKCSVKSIVCKGLIAVMGFNGQAYDLVGKLAFTGDKT